MARRIKLVLSYDGTDYHGWQVQPGMVTIQRSLEEALSEIEGMHVAVAGSGRTDAGVHALAQVAACTLENPIPVDNLRRALNRLLPADIRVSSVAEAAPDFHPRFQATAKTYEYRIWREEICPPFVRRYVYHFPYRIFEERFLEAAMVFQGTHDFTAFAAADEKDRKDASKVRTVWSSTAAREGDLLVYRVRGSGFLKHMVRNLVGGLMECARGNRTVDDLKALLAGNIETRSGYSMPARGLFLVSVEYC
ncbi:MAG: tRNA pseudouridine(38-40) synthase TruA [Candidatus Solibacter usitatus]|nr:tRNA pseudouridine(38-40) synthase TruA [Candidatus Solibacter usitatus]